MRAITDKDREEGFVEQLMVYTFPGKGRDKKKPVTLQGWIPLTQDEWDNPAAANLVPERQGWWHDIVKHPAPGQVYRFIYNPEKQVVRATIGYVGLWDHPERVACWRRERDAVDQAEQERRLAEKGKKNDPLAEHFAVLRDEYQRRHGAARRAFLVRLIYEVTGR
jgi:hypothetical protein